MTNLRVKDSILSSLIYTLHLTLILVFLVTVGLVIQFTMNAKVTDGVVINVNEMGELPIEMQVLQYLPSFILGVTITWAVLKSILRVLGIMSIEKTKKPKSVGQLLWSLCLRLLFLIVLFPTVLILQIVFTTMFVRTPEDAMRAFVILLFIPLGVVLNLHDVLTELLILGLSEQGKTRHNRYKMRISQVIGGVQLLSKR